jgi:hypothetical protein
MLGFIEIVWGQFDNPDEDTIDGSSSLIDTLYNIEDGYLNHGVSDESFDKAIAYLSQWDYGEAEEIIWDLNSRIGTKDDVIYRDAEGNVWDYWNVQHPPVAGTYLIAANSGLGYAALYAIIDSTGNDNNEGE